MHRLRHCTRKDTTPVLFALRRVILLRSDIVLCTVVLSFGQFNANKMHRLGRRVGVLLQI